MYNVVFSWYIVRHYPAISSLVSLCTRTLVGLTASYGLPSCSSLPPLLAHILLDALQSQGRLNTRTLSAFHGWYTHTHTHTHTCMHACTHTQHNLVHCCICIMYISVMVIYYSMYMYVYTHAVLYRVWYWITILMLPMN